MHLYTTNAIPLTGITTTLFRIKTEMTRPISSRPGLKCLSKHLTYVRKYSCIRSRVRSRGFAYRHLIDDDHLVELFVSFDALERAMTISCAMKQISHNRRKSSIDERRFPRTTHACHNCESFEWYVDTDVLKVIFCCTFEFDKFRRFFG